MKPWRSVFAIVPACHADIGHYRNLWQRHFYDGLQNAVPLFGTPDIHFDWAFQEHATSERALAAGKLREQIRQHHQVHGIDAIFSYARSVEIDPLLVREVTAWGIPWINFFCDSIGDFASVQDLASETTLNWFPELNAVADYQALGRTVLCRPYAYNPMALPALPSSAKPYSLGFVGMPTNNRVALLAALALCGCPCEIRGPGWIAPMRQNEKNAEKRAKKSFIQHSRGLMRKAALTILSKRIGPSLDDRAFLQFLAECQVVLGLNNARNAEGKVESYLKFRDLEMPGHGCCYLTQDNADIRASLIPDREVLVFSNLLEARDKARFYARRPELTQKIAEAARRRVLTEHTWPQRLKEIQHALE